MTSKKILIISPHFPPSNLAAVHRSRLFAQHLPEFNWEPVVLTVDEKYYEESLDHNLEKLLPEKLRVEKVKAFPISKPRLIGDVGLRGFVQLYKKAKDIILKDEIDFLYIPIPSFYIALLGRWLNKTTGVKYGIDYIDPWVHNFPGSNKKFSRHWVSSKIAKFLEPIAVKKASLISGVAEGYYQGVIDRNPHLADNCIFTAMPYGGERADHDKIEDLAVSPYLFEKEQGTIKLVYAGAMLPKAYAPLEAIFKAIQANADKFRNVQFHFIGTGKTPNDPQGYNIKALAEKYGLWRTIVFEYPRRIPYLDVLIHLKAADAIFILGSTEPHYTPSKVYQGVLSGKPIVAVLHRGSTAVEVLQGSNAGMVLDFNGEKDIRLIEETFSIFLEGFLSYMQSFDISSVNYSAFENYSAKAVTQTLTNALNKIIE